MSGFDRVVVATDEDRRFLPNCKLVVRAWRKFFPGIPVTIALVSQRRALAQRIADAADCDVMLFWEPRLPTGNYAKVARYLAAARYSDEVCLVHDMDTVPLQRDYYVRLTGQRRPGRLMAVGAEVYAGTPHAGKFPAGCITAEGRVFAKLLEPWHRGFAVGRYDHKEDPAGPEFSDESLLRVLIEDSGVEVQHVERAVDIRRDWVDRSWWGIDKARLLAGEYVECNLLRPMLDHAAEVAPITHYICGREPAQVALCA